MYIHIGNDVIISGKNLIAIINMTNPLSPDLMEIIEDAQLDKRLSVISTKEKKSLVVCDDKIIVSPISSDTLLKRATSFRREV